MKLLVSRSLRFHWKDYDNFKSMDEVREFAGKYFNIPVPERVHVQRSNTIDYIYVSVLQEEEV